MALSEENRLAADAGAGSLDLTSTRRIFRYCRTSPDIIRLAVMMYVRYPLSLRNVEDMLHERRDRLRWSPFGGQIGGSAKLGSGVLHAAISMPAGAMWTSAGVRPPKAV